MKNKKYKSLLVYGALIILFLIIIAFSDKKFIAGMVNDPKNFFIVLLFLCGFMFFICLSLMLLDLFYYRISVVLSSPYLALAHFLSFFFAFIEFTSWYEYEYCIKKFSSSEIEKY